MNETYHETINGTPMELQLNIKPSRIWQNWIKVPAKTPEVPYERKIYLARETMHKKLRTRADRKNAQKTHFQFKINDLVLVRALNVSDIANNRISKFFHVYEGPYIVKEILGSGTYLLYDEKRNVTRGKFHITHLKPYYC